MKLMIYLLALTWPALQTFSQPPPATIRPLSVGDTVPDLVLKNVINHPASEIQLSSLKGKIVILDFFATWCGACVKELPRLDSLQQQLSGQLQVLVICYEPLEKIQAFLAKNKMARSLNNLPFLTADTLLGGMFPHRLLPHEVWIGNGREIKAITSSEYVTASNINSLLSGNNAFLPLKKDALDFDKSKTLLDNNNGGSENDLLFRTKITGFLEGIPTMAGQNIISESGLRRTYYINQPLLSLYGIAMKNSFANRLLLEVKDTTRYLTGNHSFSHWARNHTFSYEISTPLYITDDKVNLWMRQDLDRFFGIHTNIEKRKINCMILTIADEVRLKEQSAITAAKTENELTIKALRLFIKKPLSELVKALNNPSGFKRIPPVIIDETGYTCPVSIAIPAIALQDSEMLKEALASYGLLLIKAERELEMFVVSEDDVEKPVKP